MKRVRWANTAVADLQDIQDYLSETCSAAVAQGTIGRLVPAPYRLLEYPKAGGPLDHPRRRTWKPRQTRYIPIHEPVAEGIDIVRVRHDQDDRRPSPQ